MPLYHKHDPNTIQMMFNSIARRYDLVNAVLSFQLHKRWNRTLVKKILVSSFPHTFLDLCCGTGDIAFHYLQKATPNCQAYLVDFCSEMLACAKEKSIKLSLTQHQLHYLESDVQYLPLADASIDCATMAYGIRNVKDPAACIQEAYRVLKPNGRFGILELTRPEHSLLRFGHTLYLKTALPIFGRWLTANREAYQYLCNSIHTFIAPNELEELFLKTGFTHTSRLSLSGGIATILIGYKAG